jgi:hypothetical protein
MHVSAVELAEAFHANEVAAQKKYGGQVLDVTGIVTGVVLDFMNDPVIHLEGANEFLAVQASFPKSAGDQLGQLSKGQQITVRCSSLTSVISAPMLSDCILPPVSAPATAPDQPQSAPSTEQASPPAAATQENTAARPDQDVDAADLLKQETNFGNLVVHSANSGAPSQDDAGSDAVNRQAPLRLSQICTFVCR